MSRPRPRFSGASGLDDRVALVRFSGGTAKTVAAILSSEARTALDLYREIALRRFGDAIERIVLFGSRARGDFDEESDWDVAVFINRPVTPSDRYGMSEIGHEVMCRTGAMIQSIVLPSPRWSSADELSRNIRREGTPIYASATATNSFVAPVGEASGPMGDIDDNLAKAERFAALARKTDPADYEGVIHAAYYAMFHLARAALMAAKGSAPTKHGRVITSFAALAEQVAPDHGMQHGAALRAAYNLRLTSDYDETAGDLSRDAVDLLRRMEEFIVFCRETVAVHRRERGGTS